MAAYSVRMTFLQQSGQCRYARSAKKAGKKGTREANTNTNICIVGFAQRRVFPSLL